MWFYAPSAPAAPLLAQVIYTLTAEVGEFAATGVDTGVNKTAYVLQADTAAFSSTFVDAGLVYTNIPPLIKDISFIVTSLTQQTNGAVSWDSSNFAGVDFVAGDLAVVFSESSQTVTPPAGWDTIPGCPVVATGVTLYGFYRFKGSWTSTRQTFTAINHQNSTLLVFRNVDSTNPFASNATSVENAVTTAMSWPGLTTTRDKSWVVYAAARAQNSATAAQQSAITPPSGVTGVVERVDSGSQLGDDGGISVVTGLAATAGTFGSATATLTTASEQALLTLALNPQQYTGLVLDANSASLTPQVSGVSSSFNNVRYLAGRYYALSAASNTSHVYSQDGINWELFNPQSGTSSRDIACNDSETVFVTVGSLSGTFGRSTDGISFDGILHGMPLGTRTGIAFGNGVFVAVGLSGLIGTSTDGTSWTARTSGVTTDLNSVVWGGGQFVAVGESGVVLTSPDGFTWTRQANVPSNTITLNSVAYGNGTYVIATSSSNIVWVSQDAVNWASVSTPSIASALNPRIVWTGQQFIRTSASGGLATSSDGYRWFVISTGTSLGIFGCAFNGAQVVLVGEAGSIWTITNPSLYQVGVQSSVDSGPKINRLYAGRGISNTRRGLNTGSTSNIDKPATNGSGLWIAPNSSSNINSFRLSTDGGRGFSTGTGSAVATRRAAAFGAGVFVFVGLSGFIESSTTGLSSSWTTRTSGTTNNLVDVIYAGGRFVAVGAGGSVCVSTDGVSWTHTLTGFGVGLGSVIWDGTQYMASSSDDNKTYVSTDGVTWTLGASIGATSAFVYRLAFGGGRYLASASNGSAMFWSSNGTSWNTVLSSSLPVALAVSGYITHTGKRFVVVRGQYCFVSENGEQWLDATPPLNTTTLNAAVSDTNGNILLTGNTGVVWSAQDEGFQSQFVLTGNEVAFSSLVSYTLLADAATYSATGVDATLHRGLRLVADIRAYGVTGYDAGLVLGRSLTADQASFTITGPPNNILRSVRLAADVRAYDDTFFDAGLITSRRLVADLRTYALTGVDAGLARSRPFVADTVAFAVTGVGAGLTRQYRLVADAVAFNGAFFDAGVTAQRRLVADQSSYTFTGIAAGTSTARRLVADIRTYSTTYVAANLLAARQLVAENVAFFAVGNGAGRNLSFISASGAFSVTGYSASLATGLGLPVDAGSFAVTGVAANLTRTRVLTAEQGTASLLAQPAGINKGFVLPTSTSTYAWSTATSPLRVGRVVLADASSVAASFPAIDFGRLYSLAADTRPVSVDTAEAVLAKVRIFTVGSGAYSVAGLPSRPIYSSLPAAFFVALRGQESLIAIRPQDVYAAIRPADPITTVRPIDPAEAIRPSEDVVASRGPESSIATY